MSFVEGLFAWKMKPHVCYAPSRLISQTNSERTERVTGTRFNSSARSDSSRWVLAAAVLTLGAATSGMAEEGRPALPGGMDDKPFLRTGRGAAVGGYIDMEFEWQEGGANTFDQHRLIPFLYAQVSDRVRVATEIEFEHGGDVPGDGEVKLEFAVLDFELSDEIAFRGGVILSPLGATNLLHDSPLIDITDRPLVDQVIIPSTLSESGMGFFGTFYPSESSVVSYEAYVVNGFDEGVINDDGHLRVRGGRGSKKVDNNDSKAVVARIGYSPRLGIDLGASMHTGNFDDADERNLSIWALDAKATHGPVEVLGELAGASADLDGLPITTRSGTAARAFDDPADSQLGAYGQVNVHFLHDRLMPGSVFTGVVRGDWVDYDTDTDGDGESGVTLGLNFRPTEETVFKADYRWAWTSARVPDGTEASWSEPDNRFFFSFASYF